MDLATDPGVQQVQEEARGLARQVAPFAAEADACSAVHGPTLDALRASGLTQLMVPAAHGGRDEVVDPLSICVTREVLMGTSSHLDSLFALQGIGSYAITLAGSDQQQATWLPAVASADVLAALALTEPEAGSDLKSMTTEVREQGGRLHLHGRKTWISNAGAAGFYTVLAREGTGHSLVLVPADTPGVTTEPEQELIAPHVLGSVDFDGVELPTDARLGPPGGGFDLVMATLAVFRVSVAGASVGLADAALQEMTRHAASRKQFGRPLARLGPVAALLADSWADVEAARLLTYRAARLAREDPQRNLPHSSMAKLFASEAAGRVVDRAVQVMGRWGLVRDAKVERLYRQARPMRIYEGASEVLKLGIARQLVEDLG